MSWIVKLMDSVESGLRKVDDDLNGVQRDDWGQVVEPYVQHQGDEDEDEAQLTDEEWVNMVEPSCLG